MHVATPGERQHEAPAPPPQAPALSPVPSHALSTALSPGLIGAGTAGLAPARLRVLVVDDEPDTRAALALALDPAYQVLTAADGLAALEVAREARPDLILLDVMLPRLDGYQVLERLRADAATAEIPVLMVSARRDDADKVRGLDLGAVDYIEKPFSVPELHARVERTVRLLQSQSALRELAQTDALTGLANIRAFRVQLERESKRAHRYRTPLTCVMADLDQLKAINDELGHAAGDRAIAAVAAILREQLRETDLGARYGGDEFVVLLPQTEAAEGLIYAERVRTRLAQAHLMVGERQVTLGVSFGVACQAPDGAGGAEALLAAADEALYAAKQHGRGGAVLAGPAGGPGPADRPAGQQEGLRQVPRDRER